MFSMDLYIRKFLVFNMDLYIHKSLVFSIDLYIRKSLMFSPDIKKATCVKNAWDFVRLFYLFDRHRHRLFFILIR